MAKWKHHAEMPTTMDYFHPGIFLMSEVKQLLYERKALTGKFPNIKINTSAD